MYNKILVAMALDHDISHKTHAIAQALANEGAEITALHVYEALDGSVAAYVDKEIVKEGFERARAVLKEKTKGLPNVTAKIVMGHTYRTIIDYTVENGVDCIIMGSHKPDLADYLLGSTAARVVRHAPCAVHVHRTN